MFCHLLHQIFIVYLLFRYLQEIGYTDKVLDMRSARVRSLLGITTDDLPSDNDNVNSARDNRAKKTDVRYLPPDNEDETDGCRITLPPK